MILTETSPTPARKPKATKSERPNRIRELCRARKLIYSDLGKLLEPPAHEVTIAKLATGKQRLTQEWMNRLAVALNVTPAEIIQAPGIGLRQVTVVGSVEAGKWHAKSLKEFASYDITIPDNAQFRNVAFYGAELHGDSMNKRYRNGSIIIFSPITGTSPSEIREGWRYHVRKTRAGDGSIEETIQTLTKDGNGDWWLMPESTNPEFQQWTKLEGHHSGITIELVGRVRYALVPED
jgi:hypothetical protein